MNRSVRFLAATVLLGSLAACGAPSQGLRSSTPVQGAQPSAALGPTELVPGRDMENPIGGGRPAPGGMEPTIDARSPARISN
ncbi:hypothetical protein [Roseomonas elaeocarpi]|uniref:Argininosuccinate lyase n=1 Tax=Roseomonas elaeocarpi TaxID=907779 RepID=A0ABV6JS16_9PROT